MEKSGRWYRVYRKDVLQSDGTFKREQCWQPLGLVSEQSERAAWKQFQPFLDSVNEAAKKLPPRTGLTLAEFVKEWRTNVSVNLKGSTARTAESHLRAHIIPKLTRPPHPTKRRRKDQSPWRLQIQGQQCGSANVTGVGGAVACLPLSA